MLLGASLNERHVTLKLFTYSGYASCGRLNGLDNPHSSGEVEDDDARAGLMHFGGAELHFWWRSYGLVELLSWCHSAAYASSALNSLAGWVSTRRAGLINQGTLAILLLSSPKRCYRAPFLAIRRRIYRLLG